MQERSYKLGIIYGKHLLSKFAFNSNQQAVFVIGRKSPSDILINDDKISSQHIQIVHNENNEIYLLDLNSANGTFINGEQIKSGVPYPITAQQYN
jgi:pSer/pThr/pTyr-binding forkhead associated (FHA) protein